MYQHYRGKDTKDVETAAETLIHNLNFSSNAVSKISPKLNLSISDQQNLEDSFETFIDKRNKG